MLALLAVAGVAASQNGYSADRVVWPAAPDRARVEYIGSIDCRSLTPAGSFFQKLTRWIGGRSEDELLSLPFDVLAVEQSLYMVCQNVPALVELDRARGEFKLHRDKKQSLQHPVSLCDGGNGLVFVTDPGAGVVYRYDGEDLEPFLVSGLVRPTGISALPEKRRIYVVDTGDQSLKVFDYDGALIRIVHADAEGRLMFNYPTFATITPENEILVNDGLNYQIKRFDSEGKLLGAFGQEGDGPGTFSRPKGIAVDSDSHIYVVDNLFDNVQVFDRSGQVLLAVGTGGDGAGQFWSPAGIDILADTIFIADTHNHRVQILHYLGETP